MTERIQEFCVVIIILGVVILGCMIDTLLPTSANEEKHECTTFIKYKEHYQITPMTWGYRDSFKCIECGRDWKK